MLCCSLYWHERLYFAVQTIQEVLGQYIAVIGGIAHIHGEYFLARFVILQVKELYYV